MLTQVLLALFAIPFIGARPWNVTTIEPDMAMTGSQLMLTIDSMSTRMTRALLTASPSLTPLLTAASLAYVGYVGSVMFFPAALKEAGIPVLEEFKLESKMARTVESGFIDSIATGYMKDMIGRTEVADVVRNTSMNAVNNGMGALRKTRRFLDIGLGSLQGWINRLTTMLNQDCMAKMMCQAGQFTNLHMPALGPVLRSINTYDLDEFSQALIDGTTIGDCSAVYFNCPLREEL